MLKLGFIKIIIAGLILTSCNKNNFEIPCTGEEVEVLGPTEIPNSTKNERPFIKDRFRFIQVSIEQTNLLYEETFEGSEPFSTAHDWDVGEWDYALQFVSNPVYQGNHSARFEIRKDQPLVATGKRSEVTIVKGSEGEVGKEAWYSFAVYCPTDGYEYDETREVINQWYQGGSPATTIRTDEDRFLLETGNTPDTREKFDIGRIQKDSWHTFVMHFIHSFESDGLIEIWFDGEKKITHLGGNMYDDILPKWKIGIYKSSFKSGSSCRDRRVIYFDNVRVGDENATYEEMITDQ